MSQQKSIYSSILFKAHLLQHVLDECGDLRPPFFLVDVGVFARLDFRAEFVDVPAMVEQ